jgi:MFS family permease
MSDSPAAKKTAGEMIVGYFKDFGILRETGREYWGIQIVNFLDCTSYFSLLTIVTLFLSDDLHVNDAHTGYVVAGFTSAVTLLLTFSGTITDWLGIRKALRFSMSAMLVLRAAMVVVGLMPSLPHRGWLAAGLLVLMAPFMAGIQTVFQAACQRYTTSRSRSAGFNLWYLFMNIGAAAGGAAVDIVRLKLRIGNVHIFTLGVITAVLCLIVAEIMVRRDNQLRAPDEAPEPAAEKKEKKSPWRIFLDVVSQPAFFRLLVLIALILGVRAVYTYLYLLMPKYWERTIGPDAAIGVLNMINPIGIVIGIILFIPLANKFKVYSLLVYGAMVSAFALFPMALSWQLYIGPTDAIHRGFAGLFHFIGGFTNSATIANAGFWWTFNGSGIVNAHYAMAILCMAIVTVGEVLWSPKLYEYTAAIAPQGQEGTYLGLSMIPWFLAKTLVSIFSGHMLARWSPETVTVGGTAMPLQQAMIENRLDYWHTPAAMWLLLGIYAMIGCILAALLRNWLTKGARFKSEPQSPPTEPANTSVPTAAEGS